MSEVQVRVRHADDAKSVPFTSWPLGEMESLVERVLYEGGIYFDGNYQTNITTQLVLEDGRVFYELILGVDDD